MTSNQTQKEVVYTQVKHSVKLHFIHPKAVANILNDAEIYFYWED